MPQIAKVLKGFAGIRAFNEEILRQLKRNDVFYILGATSEAVELMGPYFLDWHKRRIAKGIKCKIIYAEEARKYGEERKRLPLTEVRFLPPEATAPPTLVDIARDSVATILFRKKPACIVVKNKKIAKSYLIYFNLLWKIAKK